MKSRCSEEREAGSMDGRVKGNWVGGGDDGPGLCWWWKGGTNEGPRVNEWVPNC